jgi:isoamylase
MSSGTGIYPRCASRLDASGHEMRGEDWANEGMRCFGVLMDGRARPTGVRQRGVEATMLLILNAHHDLVQFTLPPHAGEGSWQLLVDTNISDTEDSKPFPTRAVYGVTGRPLLLCARV